VERERLKHLPNYYSNPNYHILEDKVREQYDNQEQIRFKKIENHLMFVLVVVDVDDYFVKNRMLSAINQSVTKSKEFLLFLNLSMILLLFHHLYFSYFYKFC